MTASQAQHATIMRADWRRRAGGRAAGIGEAALNAGAVFVGGNYDEGDGGRAHEGE
jgi:hypothetical protein